MKKKKRTGLMAALLAAAFALSVAAIIVSANRGCRGPLVAVYYTVGIASLAKLAEIVYKASKASGVPLRKRIGRFLKKVFMPRGRDRGTADFGRRCTVPDSETRIVFEFGLKDRLKKVFDRRKKADPRRGKNNAEKTRLLYIRRVLETSGGREIPPSLTPREAARMGGTREDPIYPLYEKVRYAESFTPTDAELASVKKQN